MTKQFFRKADGVVLMYDITSEYSFSDVRYWLSCIQVGEVPTSWDDRSGQALWKGYSALLWL